MATSKLFNLLMENREHGIHEALRHAQKKGKLEVVIDDRVPSKSLDLNGVWSPAWNMGGLELWFKAIVDWISLSIQMAQERGQYFSWYSLKSNFSFLFRTHPFSLPWSGWLWCISSLEDDAESFLEDLAWKKVEEKQQKKNLNRRNPEVLNKYKTLKDKEKEAFRQKLGDLQSEFELFMKEKKGLEKHGNIWINLHDPTVFVIDHRLCPYDDPSGWNEQGLKSAMELWLREYGITLPVVLKINRDN